jgi:hypothetical protein
MEPPLPRGLDTIKDPVPKKRARSTILLKKLLMKKPLKSLDRRVTLRNPA